MGHPADTASHAVDVARGDRSPDVAQALQNGISPEAVAYVNQAAEAYRRANELELARRDFARERRRKWWGSVWTSIGKYYNDKIALLREGKYLLASTKIVVDGVELFHADIAIALIAAGVIAITGGVTAVMAPIIVGAVAAALRVFKTTAGVLKRVRGTVQHGKAATIFKVELRRVERNILDLPEAQSSVHYERDIDVSRDLTDDDRRLMSEENQGTTAATDDAGDTDAVSPARRLKRDEDYDELMGSLPPGTVELAARGGASIAQVEARTALRKAYWAKFGEDLTMKSGMDIEAPMRILKYPPLIPSPTGELRVRRISGDIMTPPAALPRQMNWASTLSVGSKQRLMSAKGLALRFRPMVTKSPTIGALSGRMGRAARMVVSCNGTFRATTDRTWQIRLRMS